MEKGFNGLACRTDAEMGAVAGTQDVIGFSFSWRNDLNFPAFLQRICPISVRISPVSEQAAKRNRRAVSVNLFCSQQVGAGRRRNLRGSEQGEAAGSEHDKGMEFHAIIPLLTRGVIAFVTEPGSDSCACAVRTPGSHDGAGIHGIAMGIPALFRRIFRPDFRQCLESRRKTVQTSAKSLVTGQRWKPRQEMAFGVVVDGLAR